MLKLLASFLWLFLLFFYFFFVLQWQGTWSNWGITVPQQHGEERVWCLGRWHVSFCIQLNSRTWRCRKMIAIFYLRPRRGFKAPNKHAKVASTSETRWTHGMLQFFFAHQRNPCNISSNFEPRFARPVVLDQIFTLHLALFCLLQLPREICGFLYA